MSFAKKPERPPPRQAARPFPFALFVRTFLIGMIAIGGALWALTRHYTHTPPPMRVPVVPREAPTYDVDAGEVPVPDFGGPEEPPR
jgi:hypothetical protein